MKRLRLRLFIEDLDNEESVEESTVADAEEELDFGDVGEGNNFGQMRAEEMEEEYMEMDAEEYDAEKPFQNQTLLL